MSNGRRRSIWYAIAGAGLSAGAPAGLLVLREVASPQPVAQELFTDWLTYVYVFLATAVMLATLGFVLGRQADRLARLSAHDPLTGLLNRRAFRRRLREELDRSIRYGSPVSLIVADVDGLKQLNDERGHAAGDRALCSVAVAIQRALRGSDFGARWGGDEFAIVAPNTPSTAALRSAERLVTQVRERASEEGTPLLSVSMGIASFDPARHGAADVDALVRAADDALYVAKAGGRGRVRVAERMGKVPPRAAEDDAGKPA